LVPHFLSFSLLIPLPIYYILIFFLFFCILIFFKKRGNINIDLKSVVTTKRFESRFFFGLNSLEKTLKLCKYINNIFLDFVGIFEKKKIKNWVATMHMDV